MSGGTGGAGGETYMHPNRVQIKSAPNVLLNEGGWRNKDGGTISLESVGEGMNVKLEGQGRYLRGRCMSYISLESTSGWLW